VNIRKSVASGLLAAALATAAFAADEAPGAANPPSANGQSSSDTKYSRIAQRNIFYPRQEAAADVSPGEEGSTVNPQGSGLLVTGVVQSADKVYVVIENRGTGESSIVTPGESTGAGQLVAAALDGITLSTESGSFRIPVGSYLSGARGPGASSAAQAPSPDAGGGRLPAGGHETARDEHRPSAGVSGDAPGQRGAPQGDGTGRSWGSGRRGPNAEQMESFRNMTPEQREQLRQSMRQRRGRRQDNGEQNQ